MTPPRKTTPATERVAAAFRHALARRRDRLGPGPLLLAVSGGADSLAMLLAAASIPRAKRPELIVGHFSHGLRPDAEPNEAALVHRVAGSLSIPVVHATAKVAPNEAAAREARYAFLAETAAAHGATAIATAHTLDDQAETLLLRLTRGAGTRGAGAIRELSTRTVNGAAVTLFRPLLQVPRADTEAVCREAGVCPAADVTNRSVRYARNRIRLRVLPELERINPVVRDALAHYAAAAQEEDDLLESLSTAAVQGGEVWEGNVVRWPRNALAALPRPLLARVLQAAWRRLAGEGAALSTANLDAVRRLVASPEGGEVNLGGGLRFTVEQDTCRMGNIRHGPLPMSVELQAPGEVRFGPWRIVAMPLADSHPDLKADAWEVAVDAERAGAPLHVRGRRPADRFHLLGMPGPAKLQDVLVNARVPRSERDDWPLVVGAEGIVWVPGVRIAEWAKITETTRKVVRLTATREPLPA